MVDAYIQAHDKVCNCSVFDIRSAANGCEDVDGGIALNPAGTKCLNTAGAIYRDIGGGARVATCRTPMTRPLENSAPRRPILLYLHRPDTLLEASLVALPARRLG